MSERDWLEVWKPTPEAPGYEASSFGRVRDGEGRILKQSPRGRGGYKIVSVKINGRWTSRQVGACVCAAFHGPRPPGHEADHKNRRTDVNQPWNLQWLPKGVNRALVVHGPSAERASAKLTEEQVAHIRRLYRRHDRSGHGSARALAEQFGVATPTILSIVNERTWNPARRLAAQALRESLT